MTGKRARKSGKKVEDLPAKKGSSKREKDVKGGSFGFGDIVGSVVKIVSPAVQDTPQQPPIRKN